MQKNNQNVPVRPGAIPPQTESAWVPVAPTEVEVESTHVSNNLFKLWVDYCV